MVSTLNEVEIAHKIFNGLSYGLGITAETPSANICIEDYFEFITYVEFGINDLSQYTLAWSRNIQNEMIMPSKEIAKPVLKLLEKSIQLCKMHGVDSSIGLDLKPSMKILNQLKLCGTENISCVTPLIPYWKKLISH